MFDNGGPLLGHRSPASRGVGAAHRASRDQGNPQHAGTRGPRLAEGPGAEPPPSGPEPEAQPAAEPEHDESEHDESEHGAGAQPVSAPGGQPDGAPDSPPDGGAPTRPGEVGTDDRPCRDEDDDAAWADNWPDDWPGEGDFDDPEPGSPAE
ncbi:MAG TPA: hypothetical protein VI248_06985 [Kineosporiaceae bacterium]